MNSLLLNIHSPAHQAVTQWVRLAEAQHSMRILFAGTFGSRPMGMATSLSDDDVFAVHAEPETPRLMLTLEDGQGRQCDLVSWHIAAVSAMRPPVTGYPSYDVRSDEQRAARKHLAPVVEPENHVTELLLCQQVWDDRGHLRRQWPMFRRTHLNTLNVLDLLYAKGRGLLDHYLLGPAIPMRRYLNAVHRVLGMRWILERNGVPPIDFEVLLRTCDDEAVKRASLTLLQTYRDSGKDKSTAMVGPESVLHTYLARQLDELAASIRSLCITCRERSLDVD